MVSYFFSVYALWMLCSWMFTFCYTFSLYVVYMISCFVFEIWERIENEFQFFLCLSKIFLARCALNHPQGVHWWRLEFISTSSGAITRFSFSHKCKLSTGAMQGVRRPSEVLVFANWANWWKDCVHRECTESKNSILGSIEELSQGVRAGVFLKTRVVEEKIRKFSALKYWEKAQWYSFVGRQVLRKSTLFISRETSRRELMVGILRGGFAKS